MGYDLSGSLRFGAAATAMTLTCHSHVSQARQARACEGGNQRPQPRPLRSQARCRITGRMKALFQGRRHFVVGWIDGGVWLEQVVPHGSSSPRVRASLSDADLILEATLGTTVYDLLDFWHVLEKLAPAAHVVYGERRALEILGEWRLGLLNRTAAVDDILTALTESGKRAVRVGTTRPVHEASRTVRIAGGRLVPFDRRLHATDLSRRGPLLDRDAYFIIASASRTLVNGREDQREASSKVIA